MYMLQICPDRNWRIATMVAIGRANGTWRAVIVKSRAADDVLVSEGRWPVVFRAALREGLREDARRRLAG
jgi:hypothetical protein